MVRISFDTEKESISSLEKIKAFLEHAMMEKTGNTFVTNTTNPFTNQEPVQNSFQTPISTPVSQFEQNQQISEPAPVAANPFTMFDDPALSTQATSAPAPSQTEYFPQQTTASQELATHNDDVFSMFNSNQPSAKPDAYNSSDPANFLNSSDSTSAQDLLKEAEAESYDYKEDLEEKKKNEFFNIEPY